ELALNRLLAPLSHPLAGLASRAALQVLLAFAASLVCGLLWFGLTEWWLGGSPGKYLFRLRVRAVGTDDRPGLVQTWLRTMAFYACKDGIMVVLALLLVAGLWGFSRPGTLTPAGVLAVLAVGLFPSLGYLAGLALLALPMSRDNGYRGLHELLSGTKT